MVFRVRAAAWMPLPVAAANCLAWGAFGHARHVPGESSGYSVASSRRAGPKSRNRKAGPSNDKTAEWPAIKAFGGTFSLVVNP